MQELFVYIVTAARVIWFRSNYRTHRTGSETVKFVPNQGWDIKPLVWSLEFELFG
jgi:hypothetical protein